MSKFKQFISYEDGNFAIMFAGAGGLLAMGMAVAIEIAGMTSMRQDVQTNFDMATLSAVVQVSTDTSLLNTLFWSALL